MTFEFDLGILGGGQLGRMSIMAAQRMGLACLSLDPAGGGPAAQVGPAMQAAFTDVDALKHLFSVCARVTFENEFVPATAVREALEQLGRPPEFLMPGLDCLATVQDKLHQREAYVRAGVPSPKAVAIADDGAAAIATIGFPMVLKARFGGYDGRGTRTARNAQEFEDYKTIWADGGWLAEEFVEFKRELAVMVMRRRYGDEWLQACFPTMETVQANHQCDLVFPAEADATEIALRAVEAVGGEGLFGVELFEKADGSLVVNEIAPRPHNSGHYTLDWGGPSQFEQHVRLALNLPPAPLDGVPTCMANLIGQPHVGDFRSGLVAAIFSDFGVRVHWYGKQPRPGRKLGHINAVGGDIVDRAVRAREAFYNAWRLDPEPDDLVEP
ncbi:MAG TPA: ATP-grasp domain-containing protein [Fimbriimonadaceae bacterium]|nr:ATP-grasp domain-containing protein [Fimbriimonadaceae bacterium]